MAEDVVSWCDGGWDGDGPGEVVSHEFIGGPCSWSGRVVDYSLLGDLEEFESGLVNGGAVSFAIGHVIDDWTVVGLCPGVPVHLDSSSGCDGGRGFSVGGISVADDISSRKG